MMRNFKKETLEQHKSALKILRENDKSRVPFIVYLRKFHVHILHGTNESSRRFGEESLFYSLPKGVRLFTILDTDGVRSVFDSKIPSLWLGEDQYWKETLTPILSRAELIISEFTFLSPGVRWELEKCRELNKHHQTVLIIPPINCPFKCLDHLNPLDQFLRIIWADQLFNEEIKDTFVVNDLWKRIEAIGLMPPSQRLASYLKGDIINLFPVSYEKVLEGYKKRAAQWEIYSAFANADPGIDYYRFWDWFRVASVLGVLHAFGKLTLKEISYDLAYAYIELLQGIAYEIVTLNVDGSFLTSEMVRRLAESLSPLINQLPEGAGKSFMSGLSEITLKRIGYE